MKICYVADSIIPSRSANSVHVMKMCQAYARDGHDVMLVVPDRGGKHEPGVESVYDFYQVDDCFSIEKVRRRRPRKVWNSFWLPSHIISAYDPDFIHTRNLWFALGIAHRGRRRFVLEMHESPLVSSTKSFAFSVLSSHKHTKLVSITKSLADHLAEYFPGRRACADILIEPDAVDSSWLSRDFGQAEGRAAIGLKTETRPVAAYVGSLYQGRGIELIVELAEKMTDFRFLVVGGLDYQVEQWRRRAAEIDNLTFFGFVPQQCVSQYLAAADVLLMPHGKEVSHSGRNNIAAFTSPMKMFEYMASRRPIVASELPVLQEVLVDQLNAVLTPADDSDAWGAAIRRIVADQNFRENLVQRALTDVGKFTWEARAKRILASVA